MNHAIFLNLYSLAHQSAFLDFIIIFFANNFGNILIITAFVFLVFYTDNILDLKNFSWRYNLEPRLKKIIFVFSSAVFAWVLTTILKSIIASPRPFIVFESIKPLFLHGGMDSSPSGHATFFSALAISLYLINKKMGTFFIFGAILIGLARIIAGVHFPIDILFGYIIGIGTALIFSLIFKLKIINRLLAIFTKTL